MSQSESKTASDWESKFRDAFILLKARDEEVRRLREALEGVIPYLRLDTDIEVVPAVMISRSEQLRRAADENEKRDRAILEARLALKDTDGK